MPSLSIISLLAKEEEIALNTALNKKDVDWNASTPKMLDKDKNNIPDLVQAPSAVNAPTMQPLATATAGATTEATTAGAGAKGTGSQVGDIALQLAPMLIDNIGNFL